MVETKVGHAELQAETSTLNLKLDDLHKDLLKKSSTFASQKEVSHIASLLDSKANLNDMNEALASKASKDSVINALHRKANKAEIEAMVKAKLDIEDFQNLVNIVNNKVEQSELDKLISIIENKSDRSEMINLGNAIATKAELKDFEMLNVCYSELKRDYNKRIEDLDGDIDRLIENIKKEFQNLNIVINNLDVKKADFKELEKINSSLAKKMDSDNFSNSLSTLKTDLYESFTHYKADILQNKKIFEEHLNEKILLLEKSMEKSQEEAYKNKERLIEIQEKRKSELDEVQKQSRSIWNNFARDIANDTNQIRNEIQKITQDWEESVSSKIDRKEFENLRAKIFSEIEKKTEMKDLENLFKNIQKELSDQAEDTRQTVNQTLKVFEGDMTRVLDKKANLFEITTLINSKADAGSINLSIGNKVNISEFEVLRNNFDKISRELLNKLDFGKFENYMNEVRSSIEDMQRDLLMKSNIKEILSLMKNKADIDDVNKALTQIHEELDTKCNLDCFNSAMDNQAIINDALCSENCVARWTWKSGAVKNGYAVPWEIQKVNTAPDNFLWEKEKTSVMIVSGGLYEISLGFYADKKPTIQILVNGEPVMSAVNSSGYVIHHSSGKVKNLNKHSHGNITGQFY